jgi:hypothetical protein
MCGRYHSLFDKQQVAEHFHVRRTADNVGIIAPPARRAGPRQKIYRQRVPKRPKVCSRGYCRDSAGWRRLE